MGCLDRVRRRTDAVSLQSGDHSQRRRRSQSVGIASVLSRGMRFFLVAWLLKKYGEPIRVFIEKNLGILTVVFLLLLLGGFALIKYL